MCSDQAPDYPDLLPIAKALIAAAPERILWGTNWPHHDVAARTHTPNSEAQFRNIDDGRMLNLLADWVPDAAVRHRVLVENPAELYGFGPFNNSQHAPGQSSH